MFHHSFGLRKQFFPWGRYDQVKEAGLMDEEDVEPDDDAAG